MTEPEQPFVLEDTVPYLLNRAGVRIGNAFTDEIEPIHGASLHQWRVLASLLHQDPQRLTELAEHTSIEVSTVSRLVTGAIRRGWLSRQRSGDDARSVAISLTPAGRAVALQMVPMARLYERIALSGFQEHEVAQLKEWLRRIYQNMASLGPAATPRARGARRPAGHAVPVEAKPGT